MGNKAVLSKQKILDAAFSIACTEGLSGMSIREVARMCNVAIGTVYNSYPTKFDLVNDVVRRFWKEALSDIMPQSSYSGDFIEFCHALVKGLSHALERFRSNWLAEVSSLNSQNLASARKREEACFSHIRTSLAFALARDPRIRTEKLTEALAPQPLCDFIWNNILISIRTGDTSCSTLFTLLRQTIYEDGA